MKKKSDNVIRHAYIHAFFLVFHFLALSLKLEKFLAQLEAEGAEDSSEECLEDRAMTMAQEEIFEESGRRFKPWCANGKSLRMGEIILIIDSDTVVPEDCFRDAAREMGESPDVAIIQHESGMVPFFPPPSHLLKYPLFTDVMQVAHHYFENGITHFTRRINKCISLGCANGEVAPFVGHNAFLRWSAVQDAAFIDPADKKRKQWSEANVSEDFDLALRLLLHGYTLRWATYSLGGFKEGVSLTVVDELARWQKYAYGEGFFSSQLVFFFYIRMLILFFFCVFEGCNEIIFNPFIKWWRYGPISPQLRTFVWSKAPIHYKIGMMSCTWSSVIDMWNAHPALSPCVDMFSYCKLAVLSTCIRFRRRHPYFYQPCLPLFFSFCLSTHLTDAVLLIFRWYCRRYIWINHELSVARHRF